MTCTTIKYSSSYIEHKGRGLTCQQRIDTGELILIEQPVVWVASGHFCCYVCSRCSRLWSSGNSTFVQCSKCSKYFCSEDCEAQHEQDSLLCDLLHHAKKLRNMNMSVDNCLLEAILRAFDLQQR